MRECMDFNQNFREPKDPGTQGPRPQGSKEAQKDRKPTKNPNKPKRPKSTESYQNAPRVATQGFACATRERERETKQRKTIFETQVT